MTTDNLALPEMASSQSQKHVTFNEAMYRLDATVQPVVINSTTTAPPASPSNGDMYVIDGTATGEWTGRENQIAAWYDLWYYMVPSEGWLTYDTALGRHLKYDGSSWVNAFSSTTGFGWQNFQDVTTQSAPIALTVADTWYDLTNDAAGSLSSTTFKVSGHSDIWDDATDTFDFTSLSVGDVLRMRIDVEFITSGANHATELRLLYGPSYSYSLSIDHTTFKSAVSGGDGQRLLYLSLAMFTSDAIDNPAKIQARSDATGDTIKVNGWLVETQAV